MFDGDFQIISETVFGYLMYCIISNESFKENLLSQERKKFAKNLRQSIGCFLTKKKNLLFGVAGPPFSTGHQIPNRLGLSPFVIVPIVDQSLRTHDLEFICYIFFLIFV